MNGHGRQETAAFPGPEAVADQQGAEAEDRRLVLLADGPDRARKHVRLAWARRCSPAHLCGPATERARCGLGSVHEGPGNSRTDPPPYPAPLFA